MFDLPWRKKMCERFTVEVPGITEPWQIGVIVGPSGSGKTAVARKAFGASIDRGAPWPVDRAVIDCIGELLIKLITQTLSAVGFSSPPPLHHWDFQHTCGGFHPSARFATQPHQPKK